MRAIINKIDVNTTSIATNVSLNSFGRVNETGVTCSNFTLNNTNNEYVTSMAVFYTSKVITKIILTSNTGKQLSKGLTVTGTTSKAFLFS